MSRLPVRTRLAVLHGLVFLVVGVLYVLINFWVVEPIVDEDPGDRGGLTQALFGIGFVSGVGLIAGWGIAQRALRPLESVTATARRVTTATLDERIALDGPDDEVKQLADTIDALLDRLQSGMDRQRRFVANASHELRTPLAVTRTALELALADQPEGPPTRERVEQALRSTARSERLVDDLLLLAQSEALDPRHHELLDLGALTREVLGDMAAEAARAGLTLETDLRPAPLFGNAGLTDRLVTNLVDNAIRHNVANGRINVKTCTQDSPDGPAPILRIHNTCTARQAAPADVLFEPFRRDPGPEARPGSGPRPEGHGLGLSIVKAIALAHSAEVEAAFLDRGSHLELQITFPPPPPTSRQRLAGGLTD